MKHHKIASQTLEAFGDIAPAFARYSEEVLFGDVWRREQLSLRERSLLTVSALVAGGLTEQLPFHIRLALKNSLSEEVDRSDNSSRLLRGLATRGICDTGCQEDFPGKRKPVALLNLNKI